jgi:hypothetical protein
MSTTVELRTSRFEVLILESRNRSACPRVDLSWGCALGCEVFANTGINSISQSVQPAGFLEGLGRILLAILAMARFDLLQPTSIIHETFPSLLIGS